MDLLEWAKAEVMLAKKDSDEYTQSCLDAALDLLKCFYNQSHSGFSAQMTKRIFNRLVDMLPLNPIEDTEDCWADVSTGGKAKTYQHKQCSSVFKDVSSSGNITYSDVNRVIAIDSDGSTWHSSVVSALVNKMYPITFPYYPGETYKVYTQSYTWDNGAKLETPGEFNSIDIFYIITSSGERVEINKTFREDNHGKMVEVND